MTPLHHCSGQARQSRPYSPLQPAAAATAHFQPRRAQNWRGRRWLPTRGAVGAGSSEVSSEDLAEVKDVAASAGGAGKAVELEPEVPEGPAKTPLEGGEARPSRRMPAGNISALGAQLTTAPTRTTALGEMSFAQDPEGARLK